MGKLILIVDDSASMRTLVASTLAKAGYQTVEAADGVEGLDRVKRHELSAIVCDINMPRMNGLELVERLRDDKIAVPVIMLTTEGQPALVQRAKKAGAKGWMVKPFNPESLIAAINRLTAAPAA